MTCKDCLHHDVCYLIEHYGADETENGQEYDCDDFKDRTKLVEQKHGRWESANDGTHFCPHCGCDAPYTWDDIDRHFFNSADDVPDRPSNYCPNCGADMREGSVGE